MSPMLARQTQGLRVGLARAHQLVGRAGLIGVGLLAGALALSATVYFEQTEFEQALARVRIARNVAPPVVQQQASSAPSPAAPPELPKRSDMPSLLTKMELAAVANGLGWRSADYVIVPATDARPSSLEVRCAFTGSYPQVRAMLVQMLKTIPALAIREFSVSRANVDTPLVDVKLKLAVFLRDESAANADSVQRPRP